MKLISKFQLGKNIEVPDQVTYIAIKQLNPTSPLYKYLLQSQANAIREKEGEELHYINKESPLYFNYNGALYVHGSELLKQPQIFTHMGWINPKDANIDPNKYYTYNNGLFDHTQQVNFLDSDTYSPIEDSMQNLIINTIYNQNKRTGVQHDRESQGNITSYRDNKNGINPVLTGFVPGLDAMYDYDKDAYLQGWKGQSSVLDLALGFTGPGAAIYSPYIIKSGYERVKNAEHWWDYPLGVGEATLGVLPFVRPIRQGYRAIRGYASPQYNLGRQMQKQLSEGLDWEAYYNYQPKDFPVYRFGISPQYNATTVVETSQGRVRYSPEHLQRHFEQPVTDDFVRTLTEHAVTPGKYNFTLSDLKGKDNIVLMYPNNRGRLFSPGRIQVPEQFPNINFSSSNKLEDYSSLGYSFGDKTYDLYTKSDGTIIKVPRPMKRVTTMSDVDERQPYPIKLIFRGRPYVRQRYNGSEFVGEDSDADFLLTTAFAKSPRIPQGVNNTSFVYNGVNTPSYSEFAQMFPDVVWNPKGVSPKSGTVSQRWSSTVDDMVYDINSQEFIQHLKSELGSNIEDPLIRKTLIRRLTGTLPFERSVKPGEFPISGAGKFTFEGESGSNLFEKLQKNNKISNKYKTEEEFLNSLSEEEKVAYKRAKAGEEKLLGVELPGGDWGSLFDTEIEEGYHLWDIGNEHTPWMKKVDKHNDKLLEPLQSIVPQLGGKEALPRFRWAQNIYRDLEESLQDFYVGKSRFEIPQLFYKDFLNKNSKLYKAFPELEELSKRRFFFELNNGYKKNNEFFKALEHIVQNDQTPVDNNNEYSIT